MSFRERIAWITFVSIALCFGVYFAAVVRGEGSFRLFAACVVALAFIKAVLTAASVALNPADAKAPKDERERLIDGRARTLGYHVLIVGALAVALPGHLGGSKVDMLNVVLAAIVVAELTVAGAQIVLHRRGA